MILKICRYYYCHYCYCPYCHYYYCQNLIFLVLSQFDFLSFVTIQVFEFCHNLSLSFITFCFSEFCQNSSFWVCQNLSFWVLSYFFLAKSQFKCLSFVTIWIFELSWVELSFLVLWEFEFLSFVTIWVIKFGHNLSWVLPKF